MSSSMHQTFFSFSFIFFFPLDIISSSAIILSRPSSSILLFFSRDFRLKGPTQLDACHSCPKISVQLFIQNHYLLRCNINQSLFILMSLSVALYSLLLLCFFQTFSSISRKFRSRFPQIRFQSSTSDSLRRFLILRSDMEHTSWSFQENYDLSSKRTSKRPQDELAELLWRDGEVVLQSQTHREQTLTLTQKQDDQQEELRSNTFLDDQETVSWIQYPPDDDPFETDDFSSTFFSTVDSLQRPNTDTVNPKTSPDPPQVMPPPKFRLTDSSSGVKDFGKEQCSVMTVGPSHCGSNQSQKDHDVSMSHDRSKNIEEWLYPNASSSSGGSSGCSKSNKASGSITTDCKRKHITETDDESVSQSDATGNKSSQRSGSTRRSRAAEVHNLSERRRRDRINERMKALQELIPHCTKTDKASILDEAIDYLKSLQLQLQMMWMSNGMTATAPVMFPGVQTPPFIRQMQQSPLQLSQFPVMDRSAIQNNPGLVYHNPVQNQLFSNRFARHMSGFPQMQMQQMEMLRFSSPARQQSQQPSSPTKTTTDGPR